MNADTNYYLNYINVYINKEQIINVIVLVFQYIIKFKVKQFMFSERRYSTIRRRRNHWLFGLQKCIWIMDIFQMLNKGCKSAKIILNDKMAIAISL